MDPDVRAWLEAATADAVRRGMAELAPMLETLARSTEALRDADERNRQRAEPERKDPEPRDPEPRDPEPRDPER